MSQTWYLAKSWSNRIEEVEVDRSTEDSVWLTKSKGCHQRVLGRRSTMRGSYEHYFPSQAEAISFIKSRFMETISQLKQKMEQEQKALDAFEKEYPSK